jgi:F-type H+-transporting ATPase subunit b
MNLLEILGKVGFDWQMALANLVNFLIIFWILKKFAFGPIAEKIKSREEKINQGLENSEKAKTDLMLAEEKYKERITKAKKEAEQIISKASIQGKQLITNAEQNAQDKSEDILNKAKEMISKEKIKLKQEIKQETIDLAVEITEKLIKEKLDPSKDEKIINTMI